MKLSEFIKQLETKLDYYGDGDVKVVEEFGVYSDAIIQTTHDYNGEVTYVIQ